MSHGYGAIYIYIFIIIIIIIVIIKINFVNGEGEDNEKPNWLAIRWWPLRESIVLTEHEADSP